MGLFNRNLDISNFIKINSGGIQIASFADIRDTLIKCMQTIYGADIDVDSASADGQWINQIALILNNCFQCVKYSYNQLDPASANGSFLDILCSYNNIFRKELTASTASLWVKNISGIKQDNVASIQFIDKSGTLWTWTNKSTNLNAPNQYDTSWEIDDEQLIEGVMCNTLGSVIALGAGPRGGSFDWDTLDINNAGDINQSVEFGKWKVYQESDANVGSNRETDPSLRSRRVMALGNQSVSVLSGLKGALLNVDGIEDVYIYNNNTNSSTWMNDETEIPAHSVYVCLKYADIVMNNSENAFNDIIGRLIYNKLTPGVPSIQFSPDVSKNPTPAETNSGDSKNYKIYKTANIIYNVYWKKCKPYQYTKGTHATENCFIAVTLLALNDLFDWSSTATLHNAISDVEKSIAKQLVEHLNSITLSEDVDSTSILNTVQKADISKNGTSTFFATSAEIDGASDGILQLPNTYIKISESDVKFKYGSTSDRYRTLYVYVGA